MQICMRRSIVYMHSSVVDLVPHPDQDPWDFYDFRPPGSASGSVITSTDTALDPSIIEQR